jgi:hypothetical protein
MASPHFLAWSPPHAGSSFLFEPFQRLRDRQLSARHLIEHVAAPRGGRIDFRTLIDFYKRQLAADFIQPVFDVG